MNVKELTEARNRRPFRAFRIHRTSGDPIDVMSGLYMSFSPSYREAHVSLLDERMVRFATASVTHIELLPEPQELMP